MAFRVLGITDAVTTCECCGKKNLKRTVVMEDVDGGGIVHFGTVCANNRFGLTVAQAHRAAQRNRERRLWQIRDALAQHEAEQWAIQLTRTARRIQAIAPEEAEKKFAAARKFARIAVNDIRARFAHWPDIDELLPTI